MYKILVEGDAGYESTEFVYETTRYQMQCPSGSQGRTLPSFSLRFSFGQWIGLGLSPPQCHCACVVFSQKYQWVPTNFQRSWTKCLRITRPSWTFTASSSFYAKEISMSAISVWEVRSTSARRTLLLCEHAYQAKYVP